MVANEKRIIFKTRFLYLLSWYLSYLYTGEYNNFPLRWRHNDHGGVSNHQPHGCLLNRLFRRRSKKTSKLCVTGLCAGNSPGSVNSTHKGPVTRKTVPFDDVIMPYGLLVEEIKSWPNPSTTLQWRHIGIKTSPISDKSTICLTGFGAHNKGNSKDSLHKGL